MKPYFETENGALYHGDCIETLNELPEGSVQCCVTSPPYWGLRDYGNEDQIGLEKNPEEYVEKLVSVFRKIKRVLREDSTVWLNLGDSYAGSGKGRMGNGEHAELEGKQATSKGTIEGRLFPSKIKGYNSKNLIGIPWKVAFALQADGWFLRQDIIWHKTNPMPESVKDRCTKSHEYIFLLSKSKKYYFDHESIQEQAVADGITREKQKIGLDGWNKTVQGRTLRNIPPALIEPCILAGAPEGGFVIDPFNGSGTVGLVAEELNRKWIGIELSEKYCEIAAKRIENENKQLKFKGF